MINFKKLRFKNFGSFGNNPTEIQLDRHSMTLVSGGNGNGKSFALLDSITFVLFGKPFRKMNIPLGIKFFWPDVELQKGCFLSDP